MITYHKEGTTFAIKGKRSLNKWISETISSESGGSLRVGDISVILCSDEYLLSVNKQFLKHDYYTDIITFNYCEGDRVSGDLFISVDSVRENAKTYGATFQEELHRVLIHGVLHLLGYDDHTDAEKVIMKERENLSLQRLTI
ncbi:MAG: rRNA maturation RNase YbeY [Bacteroidetes bacterium HGW-Bacteroidetes-10]|jgi:rRNA maturation RNase YbeY|nr:MAG: rRNA maturation RNase YbeY [Bacteroidetes bacterium HGW-Bacteroidetes-10]